MSKLGQLCLTALSFLRYITMKACRHLLTISRYVFTWKVVRTILPPMIGATLIALSVMQLSILNPEPKTSGLRHDIWVSTDAPCKLEYPPSLQFFIKPGKNLKMELFVDADDWSKCQSIELFSHLEISNLVAKLHFWGPHGVREKIIPFDWDVTETGFSYEVEVPANPPGKMLLFIFEGGFENGLAVRNYYRSAFGLDMLHYKSGNHEVNVRLFVDPIFEINVLFPLTFEYEMYGIEINGNENIMVTFDDLEKMKFKNTRLFIVGGLFGIGVAIIAEWCILLLNFQWRKDPQK